MPVKEKFVNQAYLAVTESGANTLTYSKLETGISIYEKVGWLISRMDYQFVYSHAQFGTEGDSLDFGLTASDAMAAVDISQSAVIDYNRIYRAEAGTAATGFPMEVPFTKSFADLPGGGLLVPPNPIYIFAFGQGLVGAQLVKARMFYTVVSLKAEEFWELVEQRRMIGA